MLKATDIKEEYLKWYSEKLQYNSLGNNLIRIDTPYQDNFGEEIILYAELDPTSQNIIITDDGYIAFNLEARGINIKRAGRRKNIFFENIEAYGVCYNEKTDELYIKSDLKKFSEKKYRLIQCITNINNDYLLNGYSEIEK